jgi:type IV pilus assembly protein PilM
LAPTASKPFRIERISDDVSIHDIMTPQSLLIEIGQSSLKVLHRDHGLELPLERLENGRLTSPCRERLAASLQGFLSKHGRRSREQAFCAIGARGVSMRRLTLPASTNEELERLLLLQIESEFPLSPNELAWGYCQPSRNSNLPRAGAGAGQETVVVAVKREVIEEYTEILAGCGLNPIFTLAAWVRSFICTQPPPSYALLDIGRNHSELITFDLTGPTGIRILPWGGEDITRAIEKKLEISHGEAEKLKIDLDQGSGPNGEVGQKIQSAMQAALGSLAGLMNRNSIGQRLYLTGKSARLKEIAPWLAQAIGGGVECQRIDILPGEGRSAAIFGLKRSLEDQESCPPLILQNRKTKVSEAKAGPRVWQWAAAACVLAVASLSLRYAEAYIGKPRLVKKLAEVKSSREGLSRIDRELSFLQYLDTNQPPYLNAIAILAGAAAPGTRLESISMNRRGDLSLRAKMQNPQQATDFRSKLIESGFFSTVVLEEQTPSPDRQVVVRMSAQVKPGARDIPLNEPAKTPGTESKAGAPVRPDAPVPAMPTMIMPSPGSPGPSPGSGPPPGSAPPPGSGPPLKVGNRTTHTEGVEHRRLVQRWMLDVRCSMFAFIGSQTSHDRTLNTKG